MGSTDPSSPQGDSFLPWMQLHLFGEDGPTGTMWQKKNEKITGRSFACSPSKDRETLSFPMKEIPKDQNRKSQSCQKVNPEGKTQSANPQTAQTFFFKFVFTLELVIDKEVDYCSLYSNTT